MKKNEKQTFKRWRNKITSEKIKKAYILMFKLYPVICNIYIASLCIEWWFGFDVISKYIYPIIGDSFYIIILFFLGSFVHKFCGIFRYYLANMTLWLTFEVFYIHGILIPQFLITMSLTTVILFLLTLIIYLIEWKKKEKKGCDVVEVNSKTSIGLTFKELIWILSLVIGVGISYADVKRDIGQIQKDYIELKTQTNDNSKNYQFIKESLIEINGKMDLKADKEWTK